MGSKRLTGQLGQRVRAARKAAKLNGQELAARIGMSQSYISEIERGNRNPSLPTLLRIAKVLNCPVSYFLQDVEIGETDQTERTDSDTKIGARFSQYLSKAMYEKDMSVEQFCQAVGIKVSDLRRFSLGFLPPRRTVEKMAEVLGIDSASLLWEAGYLPSACLDERLKQLFNDEKLRAAAFKLVSDFATDEGKEYVLKVLSAATEELAKQD